MRLHAVVSGRVQGVGFRYWVVNQAEELGLTGWVRNLPDHRVEVEAEGDESSLRDLEQRLHRGPFLARVSEVEANYHADERGHAEFTVTY